MDKKTKYRCMIVDDDKPFLVYLKTLFEINGFQVIDCSNVIDSLNMLKKENFDLIISDIDMPGKNGFELISKIKTNIKTQQIPVIFVSNLDDNKSITKAFQLGAIGYIKKPFLKRHIFKVLDLIDGKNPRLISLDR